MLLISQERLCWDRKMKQTKFPGYWIDENGDCWSSLLQNNVDGFSTVDSGKPFKKLSTRIGSKGYSQVYIYTNGQQKKIRITTLMREAYFPGAKMLDHIDRDRTNSRLSNLRKSDQARNSMNTAPRSSTGHKGVYKVKVKGHVYYQARIKIDKKMVNLGSSPNEADIPKLVALFQAEHNKHFMSFYRNG